MAEVLRVKRARGLDVATDRLRSLARALRSPVRLAVAACVTAAFVTAVVSYPDALSRFDGRADENSGLDFLDREVGGGNSLGIDQDAVIDARSLIPAGEPYRVIMGPNLEKQSELTPYIEGWLTYFLMPRRPSASARWVICYGCDRGSLDPRFKVVKDEGNGIVIGTVGQ